MQNIPLFHEGSQCVSYLRSWAYDPTQAYLVQRKQGAQSTKTITPSNCYSTSFPELCFQGSSPRVVIEVGHLKGSKMYKTVHQSTKPEEKGQCTSYTEDYFHSCNRVPDVLMVRHHLTPLNCHPHHHCQAGSEIMTVIVSEPQPTFWQTSNQAQFFCLIPLLCKDRLIVQHFPQVSGKAGGSAANITRLPLHLLPAGFPVLSHFCLHSSQDNLASKFSTLSTL